MTAMETFFVVVAAIVTAKIVEFFVGHLDLQSAMN